MKPGIEMLVVGAGGACGALTRYYIALAADYWIRNPFPWGTLIANFSGCLLIGLLIGTEGDQKSEVLRLGFGVGFLGALTTFSTFGGETLRKVLEGQWGIAVTNAVANVTLSLMAVGIGIFLAKKFWSS